MDSANIRAIIIESKILGAADGFLPRARIEAYPIDAITADGPKIVTNITNIIIKSRITYFNHNFSVNYLVHL